MSIYIPENMEEVAMKVAQNQVHGRQVSPDEVIHDAVRDILQALLDDALEGHYDDVKWNGAQLEVTDAMGAEVATVTATGSSFEEEFKSDPDQLKTHLADEVTKIVGGR